MEIIRQLHFLPQALIVSVLVLISYMYARENKGKVKGKLKELIKNDLYIVLFLSYTTLLFTGTIIAREYTDPLINVIGYIGLYRVDRYNYMGLINILIFIPYIYLYITAFNPRKPFRNGILLTVLTTVFIEVLQLIFCVGTFCLADMIHNTIGGLIGCGIWYLVKRKRKEK